MDNFVESLPEEQRTILSLWSGATHMITSLKSWESREENVGAILCRARKAAVSHMQAEFPEWSVNERQGKIIDVLNAMAKSDDEPDFTNIENLSVDVEEFESLDQASEIMVSSNRLKTFAKQPEIDN